MAAAEQRIKSRVDLQVSVQVEHQSRLQQFFSRNISIGGIFLEIPGDPPPIGSTLKISFEVPGLGKPIALEAEVVHHHSFEDSDEGFDKVDRHGVGLKFLHLKKKDEKLLHEYVTGKALHVNQ